MTNRNEYAPLLHDGETVLWEGRPEKRLLPPRRDMLLILLAYALISLFLIPWNGGSWDAFLISMGFWGFFSLLFLPVFLITNHRRAAREIYLLTDRRVMTVVMESKGPALRDVRLLRKLNRLSIQREGRGASTIYIGPQTRFEHYDWLFVTDGEAVAEKIRNRAIHIGNTHLK